MWTVANCKQGPVEGAFQLLPSGLAFVVIQKGLCGPSLVPQWLRLCAPQRRGPALISDQIARSHMLQRRVRMPQLERKRAREEEEREEGRKEEGKRSCMLQLRRSHMQQLGLGIAR